MAGQDAHMANSTRVKGLQFHGLVTPRYCNPLDCVQWPTSAHLLLFGVDAGIIVLARCGGHPIYYHCEQHLRMYEIKSKEFTIA